MCCNSVYDSCECAVHSAGLFINLFLPTFWPSVRKASVYKIVILNKCVSHIMPKYRQNIGKNERKTNQKRTLYCRYGGYPDKDSRIYWREKDQRYRLCWTQHLNLTRRLAGNLLFRNYYFLSCASVLAKNVSKKGPPT